MSKLRVDQLETLDGARTISVLDLLEGTGGGGAANAQDISYRGTNLSAYLGESSLEVITTIAALRNVSSPQKAVFVEGYYSAGDGGGGVYQLDELDTTTPDNGGTTIVGVNSRRWKLIRTGSISVKQFGAVGDGTTDDRQAINTCLANAEVGEHITFPVAVNGYRLSGPIYVLKKGRLTGNMTRLICDGAGIDTDYAASGTIIEGFILEGTRATLTSNIGMRLAGDFVTVRDCELYNFYIQWEVWAGVWQRIEKIRSANAVNTVIQIGNVVGTVVEDFRYNTQVDTYAEPTVGLDLFGEGCNFSDMDLIHAGTCVYMQTNGRSCTWNFFNSCSFDTSTRALWITNVDQTYEMKGHMFDQCWFSSHSSPAIRIDGQYNTSGVSLKGCHIINNDAGAMEITEASSEIEIIGCTFAGNSQSAPGAYAHIFHNSIGTVSVLSCHFTSWGIHPILTKCAIERGGMGGYLIVDSCYSSTVTTNSGLIINPLDGPVSIGDNYGNLPRNIRQPFLAFRTSSGTTDGNGFATFNHNLGSLPDFAMASMDPTTQAWCSVASFTATTVTIQIRDAATGATRNNTGPWTINCIVGGYQWQ